jgi:hypothetical protein
LFFLFISFFASGFIYATDSDAVPQIASAADFSVQITSEKGKVVYSIGGDRYSFEGFSKRLEKDFLNGLNENAECQVVFRDDVPFAAVLDARKMMQSMPLRKIRYFVFSNDGIYMTEIQMGKNYPFKGIPAKKNIIPAVKD